MLAGKIDENILNKFNKKSTYDLKNDIYFSIIKKASVDRIFYGNYAENWELFSLNKFEKSQ